MKTQNQAQNHENYVVLQARNEFANYTVNTHDISEKRLRSCNAIVYENDRYFYLLSYRTVIACIDKRDNTMYDFLRYVYGYTATSAQHISKFYHDYGASKKLTYKD